MLAAFNAFAAGSGRALAACNACDGRGRIGLIARPCAACDGEGLVPLR
jgi:DnaJ-class molecular chaperone